MNFAIQFDSRSPIYRQLEDQVLYAVSVGQLRPGDTLPSIRQVESDLGINRNTVRRAYQELEANGVITQRRGSLAQIAESSKLDRQRALGQLVLAERLSEEVIRRCTTSGLDGLQMAEFLTAKAKEQDSQHPRCAFVECNLFMAESIAAVIASHLGRAVVPLVIQSEVELPSLPPSVQCVITPRWHRAQATRLAGSDKAQVVDIGLQLTTASESRLREMAGKRVLVVVRDAESEAGYREMLRSYGAIKVESLVTIDGVSDQVDCTKQVDAVIHTPPCRSMIERMQLTPTIAVHELNYEPDEQDIKELKQQFFPTIVSASHAA